MIKYKSSLYYTRGNTPKRVVSGETYLRGLVPMNLRSLAPAGQQRNVAAVATGWRHCADLTGVGIEIKTFHVDSDAFHHSGNW